MKRKAEITKLREMLNIESIAPLPDFPGISKIPKKDNKGNTAADTANKLKFPWVNVSKLIS